MATPQPQLPAPALIGIAGLLSLAAAMGIGRFAFTPMLPLMIRSGQMDVALGGWLASANYAGYLAGALTAARLPVGARALATVALLLTAAATAGMGWTDGTLSWLVLRFVAGVCSAWVFVATAIWCLGALAQAGRSALAGFVYCGVGSGIALAGLYCLAGSMAAADARSLWLQLGAVSLLLAIPVAMVLARLGPVAAAASIARSEASAGGSWPLVACYGIFGFGYIVPATFLPVLARSVIDDPRIFGLAWPAFGAMAAVSTLLAAWCMRRVARMRLWAASHLLMGAGVLLPSVWLNGFTVGISALLVGGTFMVITMVGVQEIRARAVGDPTKPVGRMTASFALGQIAGPVLSALLVQAFGSKGLNLAMQAGAAGLLLSAVWLWMYRGP